MSRSLLIVDDSRLMRKVLKKAILMANLEVDPILEAGNGRVALEILGKHPVDLALVDINMPEMDGVELVEEMYALGLLRTTDVLMVSTERSEARVERLTTLGVKGYLMKPFRPEDLRRVVLATRKNRSGPGAS
jgi:two-component system chemotaxis response regulator CheY